MLNSYLPAPKLKVDHPIRAESFHINSRYSIDDLIITIHINKLLRIQNSNRNQYRYFWLLVQYSSRDRNYESFVQLVYEIVTFRSGSKSYILEYSNFQAFQSSLLTYFKVLIYPRCRFPQDYSGKNLKIIGLRGAK